MDSVGKLAIGPLIGAGKKQIVAAFRPRKVVAGAAGGAEATAKAAQALSDIEGFAVGLGSTSAVSSLGRATALRRLAE
eukprot:7456600-Alexandrium_andersonii.AAC.1